jgi:hypothetical protein
MLRGVWLATARTKLDIVYKTDAYLCSLIARHVEARFHCALRAQCFGSSPGIGIYVFFYLCTSHIRTNAKLISAVARKLLNYITHKLSLLHLQGLNCEWNIYLCYLSVICCLLAF